MGIDITFKHLKDKKMVDEYEGLSNELKQCLYLEGINIDFIKRIKDDNGELLIKKLGVDKWITKEELLDHLFKYKDKYSNWDGIDFSAPFDFLIKDIEQSKDNYWKIEIW